MSSSKLSRLKEMPHALIVIHPYYIPGYLRAGHNSHLRLSPGRTLSRKPIPVLPVDICTPGRYHRLRLSEYPYAQRQAANILSHGWVVNGYAGHSLAVDSSCGA